MNHLWDHENEKRRPAIEFTDGCERTEKTCKKCKLTKITVHPPDRSSGFPWNEWKHPNGKSFKCGATPPCHPSKHEAARPA